MHTIRIGRRLLVGVVTTLALVLSGCAGGDDSGETDQAGAETTTGQDEADADEPAAEDTGDTGAEDTGDTGAEDAGDSGAEDADDEPATDGAADEDDEEVGAGPTVGVASSGLGDIVVDGEGRTLYMFVPDEGGEPTCTDDCAETWPVFEGPATADEGLDESLLSTATHPSGATQVTYGGWPLYYFASDASAGDTNGQGINDVWFVIGPDGEPIRDDAAAVGRGLGY